MDKQKMKKKKMEFNVEVQVLGLYTVYVCLCPRDAFLTLTHMSLPSAYTYVDEFDLFNQLT